MKKLLISLFLVAIIIFTCSTAAFAFSVDTAATILIDAESGRIIYQQNAHEALPPASTTKILTALLVLDNIDDISQKTTLPSDYVNVGESSIYLEPGETHTIEDLLYAMMMRSANDAAQALAIAVAGSEEAFSQMMNDKMDAMGLKDSVWENSHGLDAPNQLTSAYDLAMITREAMRYDIFNQIITTESWTMPWPNNTSERSLYNHNQFLDLYEGSDGVKTGYTSLAGSCLVGSATKNNLHLIGVVLNSPDWGHYDAMSQLMDYGFQGFEAIKVGSAGELIGAIKVINGNVDYVDAILAGDAFLTVERNSEFTSEPKYEYPLTLEAPFDTSEPIGKAIYTDPLGNKIEVPIMLTSSAERYTFGVVFQQCWQRFISIFF